MRESAKKYAISGIPIFPLVPRSKIPMTEHGFKDASFDPSQIAEWWDSEPNANIGMPTGELSRIAVFDLDPRNGGWESYAALLKGKIDTNTLKSKTGGGGYHLFYQQNGPCASSKFAPGIDIKADGGYVVLPPSIHPSGVIYEWNGEVDFDHLLPMPHILMRPISEPARNKPGWVKKAIFSLKPGERNETFTKIVGKLMRARFEEEDIFTLLEPHASLCDYPLDELKSQITGLCKRYRIERAEDQCQNKPCRPYRDLTSRSDE